LTGAWLSWKFNCSTQVVTLGWFVMSVRVRFAALTGFLAGAASVLSSHPAAAQTPRGFQPLPCHDSVLAIDDSLTCSTAASPSSGDSRVIARSHHTWGNLGDVTLNIMLVTAGYQTYMTPYSEDASSSYIKTYHRVTRERALSWSPVKTQGNTSYMLFTADNQGCIGFDLAGPLAAAGYEWVLRGFFCMPAGQEASFETLKRYLTATRIGAPARNRNAFGEPVVALATPPKPT
jgi:hypothetical protein